MKIKMMFYLLSILFLIAMNAYAFEDTITHPHLTDSAVMNSLLDYHLKKSGFG